MTEKKNFGKKENYNSINFGKDVFTFENTPTQWLNPEDRMLVYVLIGTTIAVASGLGAEIFFGLPLVEKINDNTLWMWMYSQLAFALLVMVAIGKS